MIPIYIFKQVVELYLFASCYMNTLLTIYVNIIKAIYIYVFFICMLITYNTAIVLIMMMTSISYYI